MQPDDIGYQLEVAVTASNTEFTAASAATSAETNIVTTLGPQSNTLPYISGSATVGSTLTATDGTWTGDPTDYQVQWIICSNNEADDCGAIDGATGNSYTLTADDYGYDFFVSVYASNSQGVSADTFSNIVGPVGVQPIPPLVLTPNPPSLLTVTSTQTSTPTPASAPAVVQSSTQTRAEKLSAALRACKALKKKSKRAACDARAEKHYGPKKKKKTKHAARIAARIPARIDLAVAARQRV